VPTDTCTDVSGKTNTSVHVLRRAISMGCLKEARGAAEITELRRAYSQKTRSPICRKIRPPLMGPFSFLLKIFQVPRSEATYPPLTWWIGREFGLSGRHRKTSLIFDRSALEIDWSTPWVPPDSVILSAFRLLPGVCARTLHQGRSGYSAMDNSVHNGICQH